MGHSCYTLGKGILLACLCVGCTVSPDPSLWKQRDAAAPDTSADLAPSADVAPPADVTQVKDGLVGDQPPVTGDQSGSGCSAEGVSAACNPLANTGCPQGAACYLVKALNGTGCVCPIGTVAAGSECGKTSECAPRNACAGFTPPGRCTPMCSLTAADPGCEVTEQCTATGVSREWGYCM